MSSGEGEAWIVGIGHAATAPARDEVNTTELAWEAISAALTDAGVELGEIEGAVTASQDFWEGRTISSMAVNEVAGGTLRSEAKVAADGVMALLYAMARIEDGDQHLNLVVAHAKESQADPHGVELAAFDPYFERALDPDETVAAGLQADLYYRRTGLGPRRRRPRRFGGAQPLDRPRTPDARGGARLARNLGAVARARSCAADGRSHVPGRVRRGQRAPSRHRRCAAGGRGGRLRSVVDRAGPDNGARARRGRRRGAGGWPAGRRTR